MASPPLATGRSTGGSSIRRAPVFTPAWLISAGVAGLASLGAGFALSHWATPVMLRAAPIEQLSDVARQAVWLYLGATFAAALAGGAAGGWQSRRAGHGARGALLSGLLGPLVLALAAVGAAYWQKAPTPVKPTVMHLVLVVAGASVGAALAFRRGPGGGSAAAVEVNSTLPPTPPPPPLFTAALSMTLASLLAVSSPHIVSPSLASARLLSTTPAAEQHSADFKPADCVVAAADVSASISVTLFSLELAPSFAFRQAQTRDGRWTVTVTAGAKAGLSLALGPGGIFAKAAGAETGAGVSVDVGGHATLSLSNTYTAAVRAQTEDATKRSLATYLSQTVAFPGETSFLDRAVPATIGDVVPAAPTHDTEVGLEAGAQITVAANLGAARASGTYTVTGSGSIALSNDANTEAFVTDPDKVTLHLQVGTSLSASAGSALGGFSGSGKGDVSFNLELSKWQPDKHVDFYSWLPIGFGVTAAAAVSVGGKLDVPEEFLGHLNLGSRVGKAIGIKGIGGDVTAGLSVDVETTDDLAQHPEDLTVLVDFMDALLAEHRAPSGRGRLEKSAQQLAVAFREHAELKAELYQTAAASFSFDVQAKAVIKWGVGLDAELSQERLVSGGAFYAEAGGPVLASQTCDVPGDSTGAGLAKLTSSEPGSWPR